MNDKPDPDPDIHAVTPDPQEFITDIKKYLNIYRVNEEEVANITKEFIILVYKGGLVPLINKVLAFPTKSNISLLGDALALANTLENHDFTIDDDNNDDGGRENDPIKIPPNQ